MPDPADLLPRTVALTYAGEPPRPAPNRAGQLAWMLGIGSIGAFLALVVNFCLEIYGVIDLPRGIGAILFCLWIGGALGALASGILGLRDARKGGRNGRSYASVGVILGAVTILLVLAALAFAIHSSDSMLKDPNTFGAPTKISPSSD